MKPAMGSGLRVARLVWAGLAAFFPLLWLASLPAFVQKVTAGTVPVVIRSEAEQASNELFRGWAAEWGLPVASWVWVHILLNALGLLVFYGVAALIWARVRTWFGWLTAMVFILAGSSAIGPAIYTAQPPPVLLALFEVGALVWPFFFVWLYLFPDGQWVSRRLLWVFVPILAVFFAVFVMFTADVFFPLPASAQTFLGSEEFNALGPVLIAALLLLVLVAQVYRYRRVSGPVERAQTKWFLVGLGLLALGTATSSSGGPPTELDTLQLGVVPVAVAIATLRYRLWDVDVIIRKTLVYGALTALLALAFLGSVVVLQRLSVAVTGQESPVATVASTLAIAALFSPLRRRVQAFVDRRFFRNKYDTQQVLSGLAAAARDETDVDRLAGALAGAVQETVQPAHLSLWLTPIVAPLSLLGRGVGGEGESTSNGAHRS